MTRRRIRPPGAVLAAGLAGLALLGAGCGGGAAPRVPSAPSSTTTAAKASRGAPAGGVSTDPVGGGNVTGGAGSVGGPAAAGRGGGNHTVMMVGNAVQGARFSACMRRHGVSGFPDPNAEGIVQFGSGIDPRSPLFGRAMHACRALLPAGFGQPPTAAQLAHVQQQLLAFSACMQAHGIGNFPDPSGAALPPIQPVGDLDPNNPRFQAARKACDRLLPTDVPAKALGGLSPPPAGSSAGG